MVSKENKVTVDHFARLTCSKHKARFSFVCPEEECFETKAQFLCASCMRTHKSDHTSHSLPYSDVFSGYMTEELDKWQQNEFELKRTIDKFYPDLHHQMDQLYKHIADDIMRFLDISKENLKKKYSPPVVDENVNQLADKFNSIFTQTFEKKIDQISNVEIKTYIETYSNVNDLILTIGENLTAIKEKVIQNQREVPQLMAFINKEGEKLRKYCEEFVKNVASYKALVIYYYYFPINPNMFFRMKLALLLATMVKKLLLMIKK